MNTYIRQMIISIDKEVVSLLGKVLGTYHHAFELTTNNQKFDFLPKTSLLNSFLSIQVQKFLLILAKPI